MQARNRCSGFTLVELLVVSLIMMLVGGLILSGLNTARRRSRVLHARRDIAQIAAAWQAYYAEYGRFPSEFPGGPSITESGSDMIQILRGSHDANPRRVPFMDFHATTTQFLDPWGNRYQIVLDQTYDGSVTVQRGTLTENVPTSVAVWSFGEDQTPGTKDDVLSWRPGEG